MELDETLADLRASLIGATQEHDQPAVSALRAAIEVLEKAHGGTVDDGGETQPLTPHEVQFLIETEVDLREAEAASCDRLGQHERAERLRAEADALAPWTN